jgi:hypothetical protein
MNTSNIVQIEITETEKMTGFYHFVASKDEIKAFRAAAGKKAPEFMRQAMRQITRQLTDEPEAKAS